MKSQRMLESIPLLTLNFTTEEPFSSHIFFNWTTYSGDNTDQNGGRYPILGA